MKEQTKGLKDKTLEFTFPFPAPHGNSPFKEIDFVVKIRDVLHAFECKGTAIFKGTHPDLKRMHDKIESEMHKLEIRVDLLQYAVVNGLIQHPYFEGVKIYSNCILKTEGITSQVGIMNIQSFPKFFQTLKEHLDSNQYEAFKEEFLLTERDWNSND